MISVNDPSYLEQLSRAVLESLGLFKRDRDAKNYLKPDMWCHFGRAIIRGPNEGKTLVILIPVALELYSGETHTHGPRTAVSNHTLRVSNK